MYPHKNVHLRKPFGNKSIFSSDCRVVSIYMQLYNLMCDLKIGINLILVWSTIFFQ